MGTTPSVLSVHRRHPAWVKRSGGPLSTGGGGGQGNGVTIAPRCERSVPELLPDAGTNAAAEQSRSIEILGWNLNPPTQSATPADFVVVLYGAPPALIPNGAPSPGGAWRVLGNAANGARVFAWDRPAPERRLLVFPSGTWVSTVGPSAERAAQDFARRGPPTESQRFPRAVSFVETDGPTLRRCGDPKDPTSVVFMHPALQLATLVVEAEPQRARRLGGGLFMFATPTDAQQVESELLRRLGGGGPIDPGLAMLTAMVQPGVLRQGAVVTVTLGAGGALGE